MRLGHATARAAAWHSGRRALRAVASGAWPTHLCTPPTSIGSSRRCWRRSRRSATASMLVPIVVPIVVSRPSGDVGVPTIRSVTDRRSRSTTPSGSSTPSCRVDTSTTRHGGCAARGSATTRSDRPVTRAMPPSRRRCARPIRRCCTTARAASTWLARRPSGRVGWPVLATCWPACWPSPRSRSPVDGTRCSATPSSTSSRRRRRSPRTCRVPSASRSRSTGRAGSTCPPAGRPTRSRCARSATRASTTRLRRARSTPPATPLTTASGCRCCSCARTTAGASACRRPRGWVEATLAHRPGIRYAAADGSDLADTYDTAQRARRVGAGRAPAGGAAPAHGALHGPRRHRRRERLSHRRVVAGRPRPRPAARHGTTPRRRRGGDAGRPGRAVPRAVGARSDRCAIEMSTRRTLETAAEVMAPLSPRRPASVASRSLGAASDDERRAFFGAKLPEEEGPLTLAENDQPGTRRRAAVDAERDGVRRGRRRARAACTA